MDMGYYMICVDVCDKDVVKCCSDCFEKNTCAASRKFCKNMCLNMWDICEKKCHAEAKIKSLD